MTDMDNQGIEKSLYSLAHLTLIGATPAELVYIAARAGYDAVSPRFIPMHVAGEFKHSPIKKDQIFATKTALATTGLKILDVEIARITDETDPRSFVPALELGGELGAKQMIMSAWTKTRDDRNFLIDTYAETCDLAAPFGITIAKEKNLKVGNAPDTFLGGRCQTVRKILDDGIIGKPIGVMAYVGTHGVERHNPNPDFYYKKGGGPLLDLGPYYLTAMVSLLGPIKRVFGMAARSFSHREIENGPRYPKLISNS